MRIAVAAQVLLTLAMVLAAGAVGWHLWSYYMEEPWTRDGRVRADVVQVAPDVAGIVAAVRVADNQFVEAGTVLFTIDADRYRLALAQAAAAVESRRAEMEQRRRDLERIGRIGRGFVAEAQREQAQSAYTVASAAWQQAVAEQQLARLNLDRTQVKAAVSGYVTNLQLRPGNYVQAGQAVVALIDAGSFRVEGYFEESKLPRIRPGAPVAVALMGVDEPLHGHVESIAGGIVDRDRTPGSDLLANVNPTFTWVRLAQRVPVRIAIDGKPDGVRLSAGLTATVTVLPGRARVQPHADSNS